MLPSASLFCIISIFQLISQMSLILFTHFEIFIRFRSIHSFSFNSFVSFASLTQLIHFTQLIHISSIAHKKSLHCSISWKIEIMQKSEADVIIPYTTLNEYNKKLFLSQKNKIEFKKLFNYIISKHDQSTS